MITYELAKKLKDCGFPQKGMDCNWMEYSVVPGEDMYVPTLSELIESLGDRFHALEFRQEIEYSVWLAYSNEKNELGIKSHIVQVGKNAEEAMAKLYIELNKKKSMKTPAWSRLKNMQCPLCNSSIMSNTFSQTYACPSSACEFRISAAKFNTIVSSLYDKKNKSQATGNDNQESLNNL